MFPDTRLVIKSGIYKIFKSISFKGPFGIFILTKMKLYTLTKAS